MKIKLFGSSNTYTQQEVEQNIKKLRQHAMKIFEEGTSIKEQNSYYENYKQKLSQFIENFERQIEQENNTFADTYRYHYLFDNFLILLIY